MRCGVSQSVARVGNTSPDHCRHSIGYPLARSALYETLAVLAAAYPSDVILVSHILSILNFKCRARANVVAAVLAVVADVAATEVHVPTVSRAALA